MKRVLSIVLSFILIIVLVSTSALAAGNHVLAETNDKPHNLFIFSKEVDDDILQYAYSEKENVFLSLKNVVGTALNKFDISDTVAYGNAFDLNGIGYIPIIIDKEIIALLAISETDGDYGWTLSEDFSDGLNKIASFTSVGEPAELYTDKGNVYAVISGDVTQLTFSPEIEAEITCEAPQGISDNSKMVIDLFAISESDCKVDIQSICTETYAANYKYLNLDLAETQGSQSWCAAFAGAQILRYRGKGKIYAKDIMKYFYPDKNDNDLSKKTVSHSQLIAYANTKGSYPVKVAKTLDLDTVKNQINSSKPIYLSCEKTDGNESRWHAFVLRGYDTSVGAYSIWNPWDAKYISMSYFSKSISAGGGKYIWEKTIYGW